MPRLLTFFLIALCFLGKATFPYAQTPQVVRIGVLAYNGPGFTVERWQPTVDYLNRAMPGNHFVIIPTDIPTLDQLVNKKLVDFTLTNGVTFLQYKYAYQAVKILNLRPAHGDARYAIGSAVISRSNESELTSWAALKQRKVISVSPNAFGGFNVMQREFLQHGIDAKTDFKKLTFVGMPQQKLLSMVASGEADFAIAPTCMLEREIRNGTVEAGSLKVINPRTNQPQFPCQTSSRLYPNWTLARMKHVPADYANDIAKLLLQIPSTSTIAVAGRYGGWTVPVDDTEIYQLLADNGIEISPHSFVRLWQQYRGWLLIGAGIIILFAAYHLRVNYLVHLRSAQLRNEITKHQQTAEKLDREQRQLFKAQRILLTGELAAGIAHELNQPLMTITTFAAGCRSRLSRPNPDLPDIDQALEKIQDQTQTAKAIIHRMRQFMTKHDEQRHSLPIATLIENCLMLFQHEIAKQHIHIKTQIEDCSVFVDPILLQQVLTNLIRNGIDALADTEPNNRQLSITSKVKQSTIEVSISDNGSGISELQLKQIFMPFNSTKKEGIGLGMVICKRILEAHQGKIWVESLKQGVKVCFELPIDLGAHPTGEKDEG